MDRECIQGFHTHLWWNWKKYAFHNSDAVKKLVLGGGGVEQGLCLAVTYNPEMQHPVFGFWCIFWNMQSILTENESTITDGMLFLSAGSHILGLSIKLSKMASSVSHIFWKWYEFILLFSESDTKMTISRISSICRAILAVTKPSTDTKHRN